MSPEVFVSSSLSEALKAGLAVGAGVGIKIMCDWLTANRTYMTMDACAKTQQTCPEMASIRKDFTEHRAVMDQRLTQLDRQMIEGHNNFKEITKSIASIETNIAVISSWLEGKHP